jgi:hypothetical protein
MVLIASQPCLPETPPERKADGLFHRQADDAVPWKDPENRSIDADTCRNRADSESAKFSFEFKSANF